MMKRTKADWVLLIEEQMESKVSIAEFCRIHAIRVSAFYNARSRFGPMSIFRTKYRNCQMRISFFVCQILIASRTDCSKQ